MKIFFNLLLVLGFVFSSLVTKAELTEQQQKKIDRLKRQRKRPTIGQLREIFGNFKAENPFPIHPNIGNYRSRFSRAAHQIAAIELMYPGAIIAPLGRDGAIFGDVVDGFYSHLGEENRFLPIELSTASFEDLSESALISYLRNIGVYIHPKDLDTARPIVIYDRTSYSHKTAANPNARQSQSYIIMSALYRQFKKDGGDPRKLVKKLMLVSSQGRSFGYQFTKEDVNNFMADRMRQIKATGLLDQPVGLDSGLVDGPAWHDSYGPPKKDGKGYYAVTPGNSTNEDRNLFLTILYEIGRLTSSRVFIENVKAEAKSLGYQFAIKEEPLEKELLEVGKIPESLSDALEYYATQSENVSARRVSELAEWYSKRLQLYDSKLLSETFLHSVISSYAKKRISPEEAAFLTHLTLAQTINAGIDGGALLEALQKVQPEMGELLYRHNNKFLDLKDESISKYFEKNVKRFTEGAVLPPSLLATLNLEANTKALKIKDVGNINYANYADWLTNNQDLYLGNESLVIKLIDFQYELYVAGNIINTDKFVRLNAILITSPNMRTAVLSKIAGLLAKDPDTINSWLWRRPQVEPKDYNSYFEKYALIMRELAAQPSAKYPLSLEKIISQHIYAMSTLKKSDEESRARYSVNASFALKNWLAGQRQDPLFSVITLIYFKALAELREKDLLRGRDARSVFEAAMVNGSFDPNFIKTLAPLYRTDKYVKARFDGLAERLKDPEIFKELGGAAFLNWYQLTSQNIKNYRDTAPTCRSSFAKAG